MDEKYNILYVIKANYLMLIERMNNGSQAKFIRTPLGFTYFACDPMFFILQ